MGKFRAPTPIPIVGTAEWHPRDDNEPYLSFPVLADASGVRFSEGAQNFGAVRLRGKGLLARLADKAEGGTRVLRLDGHALMSGKGEFTSKTIEFPEPLWVPTLLADGSIPGVWQVHPSRERALANYFERYLGELTRPVTLRVRTIDGTWMQNSACASSP